MYKYCIIPATPLAGFLIVGGGNDVEIREQAKRDYDAGMSPSEIATKYDLKPDTVRKWANRHWKKDTGQDKKAGQRDRTKTTPKATADVDKLLADAVEENTELTAKQKDFCRLAYTTPSKSAQIMADEHSGHGSNVLYSQ